MKIRVNNLLGIAGMILSLFIQGCKQPEIYDLDFRVDKFEKKENLALDDYCHDITVIPLETTDSCLLSDISLVYKAGKDLIITSGNKVFLFDDQGNFIRRIGRKGRGPDEYLFVFNILYRESKQLIYLVDMKKILVYDIKGHHIETLDHPSFMKKYHFLNDTVMVADRLREASKEKPPYILFFYNDEGKLLKKVPSRLHMTKPEGKLFMYDMAGGIHFGNKGLCFIEQYGDTIYRIKENMELQPYAVLHFGKYKFTQDLYYNWNKYDATGKDRIKINNFYVSGDRIIFNFTYNDDNNNYAISDLKKNRTVYPFIVKNNKRTGGFLFPGSDIMLQPFIGEGYFYTTLSVLDERTKQPLLKYAGTPEKKERLRQMKEGDNPVLIIAYFKK